jgi:uncharacterized membrane protein YheB (UPF0754 family)
VEPWIIYLLTFPIICGIIGYATNVVAVKMIFKPRDPVNVLGIKIQGVLPKHRKHFARMLARITTTEFMDLDRFMDFATKDKVVESLERRATDMIRSMLVALREELPEEQQAFLSPKIVDPLIEQQSAIIREKLPEILIHVRKKAHENLDLEEVLTKNLIILGAEGLERIIFECAAKEIHWIELYGGIFGFVLGLFQFGVLYLFGNMALPVVGVLIGTITNWIAIQMLFFPREPKKILFFTIQGLFPSRQMEIAETMAHAAAREYIRPDEILREIVEGSLPESFTVEDMEKLDGLLKEHAPMVSQMMDSVFTEEQRIKMRVKMAAHFTEELPKTINHLIDSVGEKIDIDSMLANDLQALPKTEFEELIRGLFEREEIYLIIYGGVLGGLIASVQLGIVALVGG